MMRGHDSPPMTDGSKKPMSNRVKGIGLRDYDQMMSSSLAIDFYCICCPMLQVIRIVSPFERTGKEGRHKENSFLREVLNLFARIISMSDSNSLTAIFLRVNLGENISLKISK